MRRPSRRRATIEKVSAASNSAIQEVSRAHEKTMSGRRRAQDHMSAAVANAVKEVNAAHQKAPDCRADSPAA